MCFLIGVLYWSNTTLDNMDGKQARRTGAGSPMGCLFDHGNDALTAIFSAFLISKLVQITNGFTGHLGISCVSCTFYFFSLQEYYLGYMLLPILTGPDDTQLAFTLFAFFTGYMGTQFWKDLIVLIPYFGVGKVPLCQVIGVLFLTFEIPVVLVQFFINVKEV